MNAAIRFVREAIDELKKVAWLSRQQMMMSTWLVIYLVIIFAIFVGVFDLVVGRAFSIFVRI